MSKKVAFYGVFAALAILMGYVESLFPPPVPVQGVKLGLANVIVLIALYFMGAKSALGINVIRVVISALLFSGFSGFLYSIAGAGMSFIIMVLAKKIKSSGIIGVSVLGGVAAAVLNTPGLFYYLPVLIISGVVMGVITGIAARYCLTHIEKSGFKY